MIVYGYKSTLIGSEGLPHEKCPNCEHEGAMSMHTFSSYAHIFWIPLFPYRKYSVAHCGNCDITYKKKEMNESLLREYNNVRALVRPPIWQFVGLFIISVVVVWAVVVSNRNNKKEAEYISEPQVGDIYRYKLDDGYSLMRVIAVGDSMVVTVANEYVANKMSGVKDLYEKEFTDTLYVDKVRVKELYDEGMIYQVERK